MGAKYVIYPVYVSFSLFTSGNLDSAINRLQNKRVPDMTSAAIIDKLEIKRLQQRRDHDTSLLHREEIPNAYSRTSPKRLEESVSGSTTKKGAKSPSKSSGAIS